MKAIISRLCLLFTASLAFNTTIVDEDALERGYFDAPLHTLKEDGRHEHVQSFFEQRRIWKEENQEDHPLLTQEKD